MSDLRRWPQIAPLNVFLQQNTSRRDTLNTQYQDFYKTPTVCYFPTMGRPEEKGPLQHTQITPGLSQTPFCHLREESINCSSQFQATVHHCEEVKAVGHGSSSHIPSTPKSREQPINACMLTAQLTCSSSIKSKTHTQEIVLPTVKQALPIQLT